MKTLTYIVVLLAGSATYAGEAINGETSSVSSTRTWATGSDSGYYIYSSEGEIAWKTGPFDDMAIECHGAGFWTSREITGDGICIFGEEPDRWTVVQEMPEDSNLWADKSNNSQRQGIWKVVNGTGRFAGMTGFGTFVARDAAGGGRATEVDGEIELK